jgi:hypothetical protein
MKVLIYWTLENNWSFVSTAADRGGLMPWTRTFAMFQEKWYPAIPIASKFFICTHASEHKDNLDN